ncbi:DUF455 domain-containing protein [Campylobacter sp. MIT 99-7217]|uniref:ferritin-like domain-containing protein n=1 Tax=Campylobacter sp. MIT 99-7217 TaxID=535091 RepID=UPI001159257E|nr:ferritin-like domain-containing protein [Campylobacter sp. MIT 99-7217]TQR32489.1 DUF455 domain-containing protein [Campylobacter sp. MIT 99-7217]
MHQHSIIMGNIPLGKFFFLRLENAFLLAEKGDIFELLSDYDNLENDLLSWCNFKGEKFLEKTKINNSFAYKMLKNSSTKFHAFDPKLSIAPLENGLSARGAKLENASPHYHFNLSVKDEIWSDNVSKIYQESKSSQWNASTDIAWHDIPKYNPSLEFAIAQIMTYLVENEFSALYIPSKFLPTISPFYHEVPLLLSSVIGDEARHIEVFIKRANATGLGLQYSTLTTQQSLYTLYKEQDYLKSSFLLHIMGEGTFMDLLSFLENYAQDEPTKNLLRLARKDEGRHVAYGMGHVKSAISNNPKRIELLKDAVFRRKHYLDELSGESSLLLESLALFAGGGDSASNFSFGFEAVEDLKQKMEKNRTKRLVECGIDEDLAHDMSKSHTPNFM